MNRWDQIESLFQEALKRPTAERSDFLHKACGGDSNLYREVKSLLANHRDESNSSPWAAQAAAQLVASPTLQPGQNLGPYRVVSFIAAGGMGAVYRAHDPRTGRDVAIKVASHHFNQRFTREVHAVAALNHPNICTLFDVGENYLVMELVEGPTLADRIQQGAIPIDEALAIAQQIADALEAAHEKGIVHRDLKPGNIKLKTDGSVKVLDFGLAKSGDTPTVNSPDSPTISMAETAAGVILGTAAYMSPEQARGKNVDKRADIWAFGVVLYEMLAGRKLFQGESVSDTLAAVLRQDPEWKLIPEKAQPLVRRCLERDPRRRLRDIGDAMPLVSTAPQQTPRRRRWFTWSVAAIATAVAIALAPAAIVHLQEKPAAAGEVIRYQIPSPESFGAAPAALSPNGRMLAFWAWSDGVPRLWVRSMDSLESHVLSGAESFDTSPFFWSSNSRFIVYSGSESLRKIEATGGPSTPLCDVPGWIIGGSWRDGTIVFGTFSGIMRVPETGGPTTQLTKIDTARKEIDHGYPILLPDRHHFIYLRFSAAPENRGLFIGSIDAKPEQQSLKPLVSTSFSAAFVPPSDGRYGQLLFIREGTLFAQRFDVQRLDLVDEPVMVAEHLTPTADFSGVSASTNGVLAYIAAAPKYQLTWYGRDGKVLGTIGEPSGYTALAISPDGTRAAVTRGTTPYADDQALYSVDFSSGRTNRIITVYQPDQPTWSPNGDQIIYQAFGSGALDIYRQPVNDSAADPAVLHSYQNKYPHSWSRDGRYVLFDAIDRKTKLDLWLLPLQGDPKPKLLLGTDFNETAGRFSPDGRWIAYLSDKSGRNEVYVRTFTPAADGRSESAEREWPISKTGAYTYPVWRGDSKEVFWFSPDGKWMSADVTNNPAAQFSEPKFLANVPTNAPGMDVTPDGKRALVPVPVGNSNVTPFTIVLNWTAGLKK
jgi:serine/threonine protein kinase